MIFFFIVQKAKNVRVKYILRQHQKNISTADNMTFIIYKHLWCYHKADSTKKYSHYVDADPTQAARAWFLTGN